MNKTKHKKGSGSKKLSANQVRIIVAVLGLIGVIITAVLNFPPVQDSFRHTATSSATLIPPTITVPSVSPTGIIKPATSILLSAIPSTIPNATEPIAEKMNVALASSLDGGKSPLLVNFTAKDSSIRFSDNHVSVCSASRACTYVWAIYLNGKAIVKPTEGGESFNYTFMRKGSYLVTVYVCRGTTCADDGITIDIR